MPASLDNCLLATIPPTSAIVATRTCSTTRPYAQGSWRCHEGRFSVAEEVAGRPSRSPQSLREAWVALAGLSAVFLFEMLDNSILNVALPTIGRELHASTTGCSG